MPEIFKVYGVEYSYLPSQPVLTNINIEILQGEIISFIGANGCGKSTLLNILCGLLHPAKGNIFFKGEQITEIKLKSPVFNKWFRSSIGFVFQDSASQLFCPTVLDELLFGPLQLGYSKETALARSHEIANMLNITDILNRPTYMLSGGEKKRTALGAILTSNPEVLIFDEPMSGLDPKTRAFIVELLFQLNKAGKTIIIATHHLELVEFFQSRVVVLSEQHTIEKIGTSHEILTDTDLLVKTNLIGEYQHKHNEEIHKHLFPNYLLHNHRH